RALGWRVRRRRPVVGAGAEPGRGRRRRADRGDGRDRFGARAGRRRRVPGGRDAARVLGGEGRAAGSTAEPRRAYRCRARRARSLRRRDSRAAPTRRAREVMPEILRDEHGIAHARADSEADAFFAQGFACAEDRLWQMEHDRLRACGRWGEVIGPDGLARDAFVRRLGLARSARRDFAALGESARPMLEAYAAGVNASLALRPRLPAEFVLTGVRPEPWLPWHSLAVYKLRHLFMGPLARKLWRGAVLRECGPELVCALRADTDDGET